MHPRKRSWIWGGLGLASSSGLVVTEQKKTAPVDGGKRCLVRGARMLVVGDATAKGLGPALRQLAQEEGVLLIAGGRAGTTIADWAKEPWLAEHLASFPATIAVVSLGLGDLAPDRDLRPDLAAIARTLRTARPPGVPSVWVLPPKPREETEVLRAALGQFGAACFPSDALVLPRGQDGVLPTAIGYAGWAGAIWRWLA
jgi:hypothetical protein